MQSINQRFAARLEKLGLRIPELLLPSEGTDLRTWSVIACDQYTSDRDYWDAVTAEVGEAPSTLKLVLPEIYLGRHDVPARVEGIRASMEGYLDSGRLTSAGEGIVYVRRTTARSGIREGLVIAIDLERYDYSRNSKSLIRATEGTIVDRIPPRLAVRRNALVELPHIMVLVQDPQRQLIEGWGARVGKLEKLYDLELMQGGGRLEGYRIDQADAIDSMLGYLEALLEQTHAEQNTEHPLFWAMGDGNHSLATAKANWVEAKKSLQSQGENLDSVMEHPARWALVELVNIHSPGLRFEPIHRAVFTRRRGDLLETLRRDPSLASLEKTTETDAQALLAGSDGQDKAVYFDGEAFYAAAWKSGHGLPPALVDTLFGRFLEIDELARIDFVHGWNDTRKLAESEAGVFFLPVLARERLFGHVEEHGPLPRKSFSMGEAEEKRYYMEARRITTT